MVAVLMMMNVFSELILLQKTILFCLISKVGTNFKTDGHQLGEGLMPCKNGWSLDQNRTVQKAKKDCILNILSFISCE